MAALKRLTQKNHSPLRTRIYDRLALRVRRPWNWAQQPAAVEQLQNVGVLQEPHNRLETLCAIRYSREHPAPKVNSSHLCPTRLINQGNENTLSLISLATAWKRLCVHNGSFQHETTMGSLSRSRNLQRTK